MSYYIWVTIYYNVGNLENSILFYKKLLGMEPETRFQDRWAHFKIIEGLSLGLLSLKFDKNYIETNEDVLNHYDQNYINNFSDQVIVGNSCILNLTVENLEKEYERVTKLKPRAITELRYINFMFPYRFFIVEDPDGNKIEITENPK